MIKTAPVPRVLREKGLAEEDPLAENVQRATLHPSTFRASLALREKGQSEEEIAANFFVFVAVVKQHLRLAAVSPKLLDAYAEDSMSLDQLMALSTEALICEAGEYFISCARLASDEAADAGLRTSQRRKRESFKYGCKPQEIVRVFR